MHFYLFLAFFGFNAFINTTLSQSLPRVRPGLQSPIIYPVGANVAIQCPAYDDETDLLFFEWSRGKDEPLEVSTRVRVTDKGVLKIKSAYVEDSGVYFCKAINGFGTVTTNVTLQVVPNEGLRTLNSPMDNLYPRDDNDFQNLNIKYEYKNPMDKQVVMDTSKPLPIRKPMGIAVIFNCNAWRVRWYRNGRHLSLRHLPEGSQKRDRFLTLSKVRSEDTGNYTCVGIDQSGKQVNNTFNLIVYDNRKPELTGFHPINSTVVLGDKAMFHCTVHSELKPHIQWLKSYTSVDNVDVDESIRRGLVRINTTYYKVLKSTQVIDSGNGDYFNNLVIEKTQMSDSGDYICLAANANYGTFSFTYKSTYLTVVPNVKSYDSTGNLNVSHISVSTVFWVSITIVAIIIGILSKIMCNVMRKPRVETNSENAINNNITERGDIDKNSDQNTDSVNYYFNPESAVSQGYSSYGQQYYQLFANCSSNRQTFSKHNIN